MIRLIEIQSFGGPGQPKLPQGYSNMHEEIKAMIYALSLGGKFYSFSYFITPPERFPIFLQMCTIND